MPGENATAGCTAIAELLPFYLNRSLSDDEARRVEDHLATCAACRQEEVETRSAWALYDGHLPVEELVDYGLAQPMSKQRLAVIESHLAVCSRCRQEVATVRQEPTQEEEHATASGPQRGQDPPLEGVHGESNVRSFPQAHPVAQERLKMLAWAACFAMVVASGGWLWTWKQLVDERAQPSVSAARANLTVVELLPATDTILQRSGAEPRGEANRIDLPADATELVLVLLSGGQACQAGCVLEIYPLGTAQPERLVDGLAPSPDGHVTLALPQDWLPADRAVLAVRDQASGEVVVEYLVER